MELDFDLGWDLSWTCSLFQNPDIVLVHYLNVPYPDDNKLIITSHVALWGERKEWTQDELVSQLRPMCKQHLQNIHNIHNRPKLRRER